GGYIIAAQTSSYGNGDIDACLIKVDSSGEEEWMKTYGGKNVDRIFSVQQTPDGGFIGAGITYSFNSVSPNDRDGYFIKTEASGKLEWYKTFGEDLYDVLHSVALTNDDGYFFTGYGESYAESGYRDVYLLNTDNMGNTNWLKVVGTPGEERGIKGVQTIDGGYIAVGITSEQRDLYLIRLDNRGELLWTRNLGDQKTIEFGYTVRETRDGGFILTGHQQSFTNDLRNIILIKTDSRGQVTDKE
ncbi:MAG: hypothetical protein HKN68_14025, partial [Saprospiraceae bacterium]|nr:hypothetical protein [Saprospiraceae bacterium]